MLPVRESTRRAGPDVAGTCPPTFHACPGASVGHPNRSRADPSHNGRNKAAARGRTNGRKASEVKGGLGASVQEVLALQNPQTEATCRKTTAQAVRQRPCRPVSQHWLCHTLPSLPVVTREADPPV